jgi:hypothetical protein
MVSAIVIGLLILAALIRGLAVMGHVAVRREPEAAYHRGEARENLNG